MNPFCPIKCIGIRHPVICSDGFMYEEKCIEKGMKESHSSPINRQLISFVKPSNNNQKCFNLFKNIEQDEDYKRKFFTHKSEILFNFIMKSIIQ